MTDSDDFLLGGSSTSAKFDNIGDSISGTIESTVVRQQTDIASGALLTWDNGDPRMQLVVVLQTALREAREDGTPDDGKRAIYVKGSKKAGTRSLHDAVKTAVQASGAKGLEVGGTLTVQLVGTAPSETRGFNDRKLYAASYVAPTAAATGGFLGTAPPATAVSAAAPPADPWNSAPATAPAFAQQPALVGAPAPATGPTPEQVAAVKAAGLDPAVVFAGQQLPPF